MHHPLPPRNPDNLNRPSRQEPREARSSRLIWPDFTGISRHRDALLGLVAALIRSVGLGAEGLVARLPKPLYLSILHILRPAEAAARRLIVVLAQGVETSPRPASPAPTAPIPSGDGKRIPAFPLFDTRKRFAELSSPTRAPKFAPRICVPGYYEPDLPRESASTPEPKTDVSAEHLCRRLLSLKRALETLPAQAKRLARVNPRRKLSPLRPGRPPGHRGRGRHPVDDILRDCQDLALYALKPPDTS